MKKIILSITMLFFVLAAVAQEQKSVVITGKVTGDTKGYNNILYYTNGTSVDSVAIINGQFTLKIPFSTTFTQLFFTQYEMKVRRGYRPFPLLIDGSGDINLEMNIEEGFFGASVSGANTTVLFNNFLKQQSDVSKKISAEISKLHGKEYVAQNDPLAKEISASRDSLSKLYMETMVMDFVKQNKNEYVGVYVLSGQGRGSLRSEQLEMMYNQLSPDMQKTNDGEKLAAYIRGVKGSKIGSIVKNFVLNDPSGKPFSFDQLKGKYVWVDFWASWCGPCKQAFPKMREIHAKYSGMNFEILGISTDSKIEPWLKILETIKNPWPQVWDSKNIMSEFAVTAFPTSFLIGPDGKIILKEVGFEPNGKGEIEKKLEEIFNNK